MVKHPLPTLVGKEEDRWFVAIPAGAWNLIHQIKAIPDKRWIPDKKMWEVPDSDAARSFLLKYQLIKQDFTPSGFAPSDEQRKAPLPLVHQQAIDSYEEQLTLRRYQYSSKKTYKGHFERFLRYFEKDHPTEISKHQIERYIIGLVQHQGIAINTQNQIINAIKFYYEKVLGLPRKYYELARPRKQHHLPNVLSQEETHRLLAKIPNLKHRCALTLTYSAGLRISEVIALRKKDINFERRTLFIRDSKGAKDRYAVLSDEAGQLVERYLSAFKPDYWLFEGAHHEQYSARSLQAIFHRAKDAAGVNPYATFHSLRHSFATHCIETGYSTAMVKELLGHNSVKTTERYLHVAQHTMKNFRSPLDMWAERNRFERDEQGQ